MLTETPRLCPAHEPWRTEFAGGQLHMYSVCSDQAGESQRFSSTALSSQQTDLRQCLYAWASWQGCGCCKSTRFGCGEYPYVHHVYPRHWSSRTWLIGLRCVSLSLASREGDGKAARWSSRRTALMAYERWVGCAAGCSRTGGRPSSGAPSRS